MNKYTLLPVHVLEICLTKKTVSEDVSKRMCVVVKSFLKIFEKFPERLK